MYLRNVTPPFQNEISQEYLENYPRNLARLCAHVSTHSPYLGRLLKLHHSWLVAQVDLVHESVLANLKSEVSGQNEADLGASLRLAKAKLALYLGLLDLGKVLPVMEVTKILTDFADFAVEIGLRFILKLECDKGKLPQNASTQSCGIYVLAMGKMGAYELNYSSDIDLIVFFDESRFEGHDIFEIRKSFIRVIQRLVKLLSENNEFGYVFRTDLRLRPDPSATPIVMTADQAESYYEAQGRTWERAAFIKARVCAGDLEAGHAFLKNIKPFIWRRFLDFAAIEDAHNMRLRIRSHKQLDGPITLEGHHLKLGRGGIREIEFFVQTRQLIFGGRDESLRCKGTLEGLSALAAREIISHELAAYLSEEYKWLRGLEHITQMIDDQQTHLVPREAGELEKFLQLAGAEDLHSFEQKFVKRICKIDTTMEEFFEGNKQYFATPIDLTSFGENAREMIDAWMHLPATKSSRAQAIFDRIKPVIIEKLLQSQNPSQALHAFDIFLRGLPAGVQVFSMFDVNPHLLDLLTEVCALAPSEARYLGQNAKVFDAVLGGDFFTKIDPRRDFADQMKEACAREFSQVVDFEDKLNATRRFVREAQFRVSVHLLRGLISPRAAGEAYTIVADLAIESSFDAVVGEMTRRYGPPPGRGAAILAMGKLGSRELTRHSDLDLVVIYDAAGLSQSQGVKPLDTTTYFSRFTQNFVQALSVSTAEGALYEVDMRLRPSGRQGPVAVSLSGFADYQQNEAWTWEHMALLRGRVVAGDLSLANDISHAMAAAFATQKDPVKISHDVMEMRQKIRDSFANLSPLALKHGAGRMMETELLLQALALIHAWPKAENSMEALCDASKAWISAEDGAFIEDALTMWSGLIHLSRLCFAGEPPIDPPLGWIKRQEQLTNCKELPSLTARLAEISMRSEAIFNKTLG